MSDNGEPVVDQKQTRIDPLGVLIERHPHLDINVLVQALGEVFEEDENIKAAYRAAKEVDETPYVYHLQPDESSEQRTAIRKPQIITTEEGWIEEIVKRTEDKLRDAG